MVTKCLAPSRGRNDHLVLLLFQAAPATNPSQAVAVGCACQFLLNHPSNPSITLLSYRKWRVFNLLWNGRLHPIEGVKVAFRVIFFAFQEYCSTKQHFPAIMTATTKEERREIKWARFLRRSPILLITVAKTVRSCRAGAEIMSLSFRRSSRKMKKTSKMIVESPNRRTWKCLAIYLCARRRTFLKGERPESTR